MWIWARKGYLGKQHIPSLFTEKKVLIYTQSAYTHPTRGHCKISSCFRVIGQRGSQVRATMDKGVVPDQMKSSLRVWLKATSFCTHTDVRKSATGRRRWRLFQRLSVLLECLLHVLFLHCTSPWDPLSSIEVYSCLDSGPETGRLWHV